MTIMITMQRIVDWVFLSVSRMFALLAEYDINFPLSRKLHNIAQILS